MVFLKLKIIFNNFVNFYFDFFSNYFFVKFLNNVLFFKMPRFFFFKKPHIFFFLKKSNLTSFLAYLKASVSFFFSFFFVRFKMRGLGYRVKHITKNIVRFFIGTTNFYYFICPNFLYVRARRRKLLLVSNEKAYLFVIFLSFFFLKKLVPYKLRGFFFPRQIVLMKPGKKRF